MCRLSTLSTLPTLGQPPHPRTSGGSAEPAGLGRVQGISFCCTSANLARPKRNRKEKRRQRPETACPEQAIGVRCRARSYRTRSALVVAEVQTVTAAPRMQFPVRGMQKRKWFGWSTKEALGA